MDILVDYLLAVLGNAWNSFLYLGGLVGLVLDMTGEAASWEHRWGRRIWKACLIISFCAVGPFLAWNHMRQERDSLTKAPRLSLYFRGQNPDRTLNLFARNDGNTPSVITDLRVCDTEDWSIRNVETGDWSTNPNAVDKNGQKNGQGVNRPLVALVNVASLDSTAVLCDVKYLRNLSVKPKDGYSLEIPAGGISEFTTGPYPERWKFSPYEGYGRGGNDSCPIHLMADNAQVLLAPICTYLPRYRPAPNTPSDSPQSAP